MTKSRILHIFRDTVIILGIGILLVAILEVVVRLFIPQDLHVIEENGLTIGKRDSVLGHTNNPGAHVTVRGPEYSTEYLVNSEGLRDETPHPIHPPTATARVLLLGDSFTWGIGVGYGEMWPTVAERSCREHGRDVEMVKAGVSGFDTRQELLFLQRVFPRYAPDVVVIAFLPNDLITNMPMPTDASALRREIAAADSVVARSQGDKSSGLQIVTLFKRFLISNDFIYSRLYVNTARGSYFTSPIPPGPRQQLAITETLLIQALSYCRTRNSRFIVLSIPQLFQVIAKGRDQSLSNINTDLIDEELSKFAAANGFSWIPTLPELAAHYRRDRKDLYFRLDGHLNAEGNLIVGEYFAGKLIELLSGVPHTDISPDRVTSNR